MALFRFDTDSNPPKCIFDTTRLSLAEPTPDLFDSFAKEIAEEISRGEVLVQEKGKGNRGGRWLVKPNGEANAPAQIRKFYDEVCMWAEKTRSVEDLEKNLPFIKMMNAKVAYARGRNNGLVDDKFVAWFSSCLAQIQSADETGLKVLQNFRTLFEAFMGFYKVARPK
jgi:CRISPR-associated protein Csm2